MAFDQLPLAAEFPAASDEQWRSLVSTVLTKSGLSIEALETATYDGLVIEPLYTAHDVAGLPPTGLPGQAPFVRGASAEGTAATGWDVRQLHANPDAKATNAAILEDLGNGASSIWLRLALAGLAVADLPTALDGVCLDLAPIVLDAGDHVLPAATALLDLATQRGVPPAELRGSFGADPIGHAARAIVDVDVDVFARLVELGAGAPNLQLATVDATVIHVAGASDAQELAYATATGVAYLRALVDAGLSVDDALARIEFRFALTDDQFGSIAKLRAARRLWARVAELSGASPSVRGQRQHAVTSAVMVTQRDPWVNMLRATIAGFAAAVGGAEAITVLPFDYAIGLPDEFARRIARNTQAILHDESSLGRVLDPAGGSWYIESRTDALARTAWDGFTAIERAGGAAAIITSGILEEQVAEVRAARDEDIAYRRLPITGVTEFALVGEEPLVRASAPTGGRGGLFAPRRYAQPFESLRDRSDAFLAATGSRPKVFLAGLGPVAVNTARVGFAANLFQAAGIEPVVGTGTPDEIVDAFAASGTPVACLCSSDKIYGESAASDAAALKAAGAKYLWLAGRPGDREETDHAAGIDNYLYAGCNALDVLTTTLELLGVQ